MAHFPASVDIPAMVDLMCVTFDDSMPALSQSFCFEGQTQYDACGIELRTHDRQ